MLGPVWGTSADVVEIIAGPAPPNTWPLYLAEESDEDGAAAYHAIDANGPWGIAFVKTTIAAGLDPAVAVAHEFAEMLVDPRTRRVDLWRDDWYVAIEVVDPTQNATFQASNGLSLPDFAYPEWFGRINPGGPENVGKYDHMGLCRYRGHILPRGYISLWNPQTGWSEQWADAHAYRESNEKLRLPMSRLAKRRKVA